ncbi:ubiquitin carboxyl-terminal hydrolase [Glonium stellatum]|uniref:Ubiquitin carboxyl-terminal hydrolase n=1 Tax=Glonium stellatum TaxID=574774 RepID=A0A8E2FA96_9PEZI|nr:ubiquitin carboxyl-terminal hydrolase [Glonium stellatum]
MELKSAPRTNEPVYRKHFIPLESNPELFTELIHELGVLPSLSFQDVLSLDDPELLGFVARPAFALILVFPTTNVYERQKTTEEAMQDEYQGSGNGEDVVWFKQTINNACGLYGILHAVCNGASRDHIASNSILSDLLKESLPLQPDARAKILEDSEEVESAYTAVARQGDSEVPEDPEDEVDFHYVCFVRSSKSGHVYELDGDRKGPIDRGEFKGADDMLCEDCLNLVREFVTKEKDNLNFSLMALVLNE